MWVKPVIGVLLIVAGTLGLAFGKFDYTKETHETKLAGIEFSVKEKETVQIPPWAAGGAIAAGTLLLLFGRRK